MLLPHEALGNRISELSAHLNAAKSQLLDLIAAFDACGGWADEGCQEGVDQSAACCDAP